MVVSHYVGAEIYSLTEQPVLFRVSLGEGFWVSIKPMGWLMLGTCL